MELQTAQPRLVGGNKRKEVGKRPTCAKHPNDRIWIAGRRRRWSAFHEHQEFFCVSRTDKKVKHRIIGDVIGRHPAEHNPSGAEMCPHCEHALGPSEGPRAGRDYTFAFREQAGLLVRIGMGGPAGSFRKASRATRKRAFRYSRPRAMRLAAANEPRNYTARKEPWVGSNSKEPALAMAYVDQYAPVIAAELLPTVWPSVVAIDSKPYKRRELVEDPRRPGAGTYNSGGTEYGEVMAAVDHTVRGSSKVFALHLDGGKDQSSWEAFFRSRTGQPRWVVADQDPALEAAMLVVWPGATLYNCDAHLRLNATDYLVKDGIPVDRVKARIGEEPNVKIVFEDHPLHKRLLKAVQTRKGWERFKAGVEHWVPIERAAGIRKWVRDTEPLILYQMDLRAANPDMWLVSNGSVEAHISTMNEAIGFRIVNYKNAARLQKVIDLMTIEMREDADEAVYAKILTNHFAAKGGRPAPKWDESRIGVGRAWTIDGIVAHSTHRNAIRIVAKANAGRTQREVERRKVEQARLSALGMTRLQGRKRRPNGPAKYVAVNGRVINDYVEPQNLRDEWDVERNVGLDPAKVTGSYPKAVWWICTAHADGPGSHLHRWRAPVRNRATNETGCPFCLNRQVCAWNSLGVTRTDIAADWDQAANGSVTPFDVLAGGADFYHWRCDRDPTHPPYLARISQRTSQGSRCRLRHPVQAADRARKMDSVKARMHRDLARQALPAGYQPQTALLVAAPAVVIEPAVEPVSIDLQGTFWDAVTLPLEPDQDLFGTA